MQVALDPAHWGYLIAFGAFTGVCLGLFGPAGGLVLPVGLLVLLPLCGIPEQAVPHLSIATAIAILMPLALARADDSFRTPIDWEVYAIVAPAAVVGALLATVLIDALDFRLLGLLAGLGPGAIAIETLVKKEKRVNPAQPLVISTLSVMSVAKAAFAVFSGSNAAIMIEALLSKSLDRPAAAATASALTLPFAIAATAGAVLEPSVPGCGPACMGAVFLPALAAMGMTAVLLAPLAARLRPYVPTPVIPKAFASALIAGPILLSNPVEPLQSFTADLADEALRLILDPICEPDPAPARPALTGPSPPPLSSGADSAEPIAH